MDIIARPLATSAGDWLHQHLADDRWTTFRGVAAFLKQSGSRHVAPGLYAFTRRPGTKTKLAVGISSQGSSLEGVQDLWRVLDGFGEFYIVHEDSGGSGSFHPKGFVFSDSDGVSSLLIGSANLTQGGLYTNHELSLSLEVDGADAANAAFVKELSDVFDTWQTPSSFCLPVDAKLITLLHGRGSLPSEAELSIAGKLAKAATRGSRAPGQPAVFGGSPRVRVPTPEGFPSGLPPAPVSPQPTQVGIASTASGQPSITVAAQAAAPSPISNAPKQFLIEVRPHDNGEVFLSYLAVRQHPAFFGYPFTGWTVPKSGANAPYPQLVPDPVVEILVYDASRTLLARKGPHALNVVDYSVKREIRITLPERLQDKIPEMSVLVLTKDPTAFLDYRLEFYPPGTAPTHLSSKLLNKLPSGGKPIARRFGWA